ncbi:hypothetical protein PFX98_01680 [Paucibacter sediminis]|uniref:Bro-N domain-containing protein n=1 Tax=Paucibacter sediminis TaxID=3019553 RepID=A0AA95NC63_9BURK|nr:hypothetical protein [Paucibacter sp. S2-9]WIT12342.1 hypothetical protein PFX98_01680 [Paucibacter sp. S2-9]
MRQLLLTIALRLLACAAVIYLQWRWLGPVGLVVGAPLLGVALARPILDLLGMARHKTTEVVYRDVSGRHFVHRGQMLDIADDAAQFRWLRISDVRKLIHGLPADQTLQQLRPDGVHLGEKNSQPARIQAEALLELLAKAQDPDTLKFKHWLAQEVVFPAAQRRERGRVGK